MGDKFMKLLEQAYDLCEEGNYVQALKYYDEILENQKIKNFNQIL